MHQRRYQDSEYTKIEGQPLPPQRLVAIQRSLPERERLNFLHSLDERIAGKVIELVSTPADKETK